MPDNNKIQLPTGFKLDTDIKLPSGFTLDSDVVKKKVGGEVSSPTELPSVSREYLNKGQALVDNSFLKQINERATNNYITPSGIISTKTDEVSLKDKIPKKDYYSTKLEKGLIFDKEEQLYAPSSEALSKDITKAEQASLKKSTQKDLVEKSREMPVIEGPTEEKDYFEEGFGDFLRGVDKYSPIGIGDFVDDMARSVASGYRNATASEYADKLLLKGTKATPEQIQKFIDAQQNAQQLGPSVEMQDYQKTYEQEGKGIWGVIKGLAKNPSIAPEIIASSLVGMATNTHALAAAGTALSIGAGYGAATGVLAGGIGAIPAAAAGATAAIPYAFGAASSIVEMGSTFAELLQEQLNGKELTKENVKAILENPEKLQSLRNKAIARGAIIGTIDAYTGKLASGVGAKILTTSAKKSAVGAVTKRAVIGAAAGGAAVEAVGGMTGESLGRVAAGQEQDISEIALEGIAELPGGIRSAFQARLNKPSYNVNGENVSAAQVDEITNTMTPAELAQTKIDIKNDYEGRVFKIQDKIITHLIKEDVRKANPDLNEPSLNAITDLEKDLQKLEGNKTQTGKDKVAAIRTQIKNIQENQIQDEVDGEEVSQEAFEALQGKPIGTKEIIKAEVKPAEVKPSEEKDYNTLYHNSLNENLKLEDIDLLRKGKSQLKRSMKDLPEELQPSGFYTTDDVMSRFMGGTNKYSFKFPKNAKVKDLAAEGRVTDRLGKKELIDLRNQGYDIIKGKNMAGQQEFIPLNKELIKDWKYEGPNIRKENGKYYYTKVTPEGSVQIEVPKNIYESIEKNRFEQIKEEVKPTEVKEQVNIVKLTDLPDRAFAVGMTVEKFEDLKYKIQKEGFIQPIIIDKESGNVLDGQNRLFVAQDLGIKNVPSIYMDNPTREDLNEKIKELEKQYIPSQEVKPTEGNIKSTKVTKDDIEVEGLDSYTSTAKSGKFYNIFGKRKVGDGDEMWWIRFSRKNSTNTLGSARYRNEKGEEKAISLNELPKSLIEIYNNPVAEVKPAEVEPIAELDKIIKQKAIESTEEVAARSAALKYLTGGKLSWDAINEVAGRVKRATLNTGAREFKSEEARSRDYVAKKGEGQSLDEAADSIWNDLSEEIQNKMDTQDVKNALMMAVSEYNSKAEMAQALIDGYKEESIEELENKYYERFGDNAEIEIDKELNQVPKNQLDIEQELINANYESEQQFQDDYWNTKEATNDFTEKAPSTKAQKAETAKGLAEAYKDLTINQKRQIINSKFDELLQELKIEKICPT